VISGDDDDLLARALAGQRQAQRELADRLIAPIHREVAMALGRATQGTGVDPRQEVLDLVQDVLVLLFEHDARELRRWDPSRGRNLHSYVRLLARRRVARVLNQRRGNPYALVLVADAADEGGPDDGGPIVQLEQRHQLDQVLAALYAQMDERDHELFDLLFVEERDPGEVAELLGSTRGAINAWVYRTRKLVRALASAGAGESRAASSASGAPSKGEVGRG